MASTKAMLMMPVPVMMSTCVSVGMVHEPPEKSIPHAVPEAMTVPAMVSQAEMLVEPDTMTPAVHMTPISTKPYMSFTMGKAPVMLIVMVVPLMRHLLRPSPELRDVCTAMLC
ncbi:hypothetical protein CRG98_002370 [Punica granatum]|uniref:Uncharacterized protein n=1 Tax=Punica granatum TaxID=22663 RepID=A0A2I0L977_PUNGR|nr:hypothetical protein CRG98_002370 [Punica granatum]